MNNKEIILSDAFDYGKIIGKIENNIIEEASGLVESVENNNSLWTHNDEIGRASCRERVCGSV